MDCEDSTDELNCTCKDYLQNLRPTAICDGYADCDDLTDERDCGKYISHILFSNPKRDTKCNYFYSIFNLAEICGKNEFLCATSKTCVSMSKKCDGKFDCEFKEDELDCCESLFRLITRFLNHTMIWFPFSVFFLVAFTDGHRVYLDANGRPFLSKEGILARYVKQRWQPVCHRPKIHKNRSTANLIGQNMCEYFGFAWVYTF